MQKTKVKTKSNPGKTFKLILGIAFLVITIFFGAYTAHGYFVFQTDYIKVPLEHQIACTTLFILMIIGIIIYNSVFLHHKIIKPIPIIIFSLLFIANIITFLFTPENESIVIHEYSGSVYLYNIHLDPSLIPYYLIKLFARFVLFYFLIFMFPSFINSRKIITGLLTLYLILVLGSIIYSLITEMDTYIEFFKNLFDKPKEHSPASFFINQNNFGLVLMLAIVGLCFLHNLHGKWIFLLLASIIYIYQFIVLSKICIFLSTAFLLIYAIYRFIFTFKKHKIRNFMTSIIFVGLIAGLVAICIFTPISNFIYVNFVKSAERTIDVRVDHWVIAGQLNARNIFNMFLGTGYGFVSEILLELHNVLPYHNQYVQEFASGGLLYLAAAIALVLYGYYKFGSNVKKDKATYIFFIQFLTLMVFFFMFESVV